MAVLLNLVSACSSLGSLGWTMESSDPSSDHVPQGGRKPRRHEEVLPGHGWRPERRLVDGLISGFARTPSATIFRKKSSARSSRPWVASLCDRESQTGHCRPPKAWQITYKTSVLLRLMGFKMPRQSFEAVLYRALEAAERKAEHDDDLDWEAWNKRKECLVGTGWSMDKLLVYRERWKLGASCIVRPIGRVIAVERKHQSFVAAYVSRRMERPAPWVWTVQRKRFAYPPTGSIKYVTVQAHHEDLYRLEPNDGKDLTTRPCPRFILDVGQCQTLPELLSYKDAYFHSPGSKVQTFVALKCYLKSQMRQMVAVVFERDEVDGSSVTARSAVSFGEEALNPVTVGWLEEQGISVGGVGHGGIACDSEGIPGYQIKVDTTRVLEGAGDDADAIRNHCGDYFTFDLYAIKSEAVKSEKKRRRPSSVDCSLNPVKIEPIHRRGCSIAEDPLRQDRNRIYRHPGLGAHGIPDLNPGPAVGVSGLEAVKLQGLVRPGLLHKICGIWAEGVAVKRFGQAKSIFSVEDADHSIRAVIPDFNAHGESIHIGQAGSRGFRSWRSRRFHGGRVPSAHSAGEGRTEHPVLCGWR
ncbi:hypothetical protein SELMODRAFT_409581 [Selaginella moellendorffii]|uniref:Uncharacterized protein n=1 Tax=Selaginella moellendorffii TaxID=88036 RepID=D8RBW9_SELML|nr:hypothetical protein SELMODRAFT_409581 [Selaginella moellendorffii]